MDRTKNPEGLDLMKKLQEGKMLSHPGIQWHYKKALHTNDYAELIDLIKRYPNLLAFAERNIALDEIQKLENPFKPEPTRREVKESLDGPIKVGKVNAWGDFFSIDENILCLPMLIAGRVGAGKSQLIVFLLKQLLQASDFNVIIPDLKREYRNLLTLSNSLKVLQNSKIKLNPLAVPEWMTPQENIHFFSQIFTKQQYLGRVSKDFINKAVLTLYRKHGIIDGGQNFPTMLSLYNYVFHEINNKKSYNYRDIMIRLQNLLFSYVTSENFNCRIGISHQVWRDENVVLEMDAGFTNEMYGFIVSYLIGSRFEYNKKNNLTGSILRTLFTIDECRALFDVNRNTYEFGDSYLSGITTKIREHGIGLILSSQETKSFTDTIKAIAFTKVCFPLTDGAELSAIKESYCLDDEQTKHIFKLKKYGEAIAIYGNYDKPFILTIPEIKPLPQLSDKDVEQRMADFYSDLDKSIKPLPPLELISPTPAGPPEEKMPADAAALLFNISHEVYTTRSQMIKFPGFNSPSQVNKAIAWLQANGFIAEEEYRVTKRGKHSLFAVLTPKAHDFLDTPSNKRGKGSFQHSLYQHLIAKRLEADGLDVAIERRIPGTDKYIDVLVTTQNGYMAYEVTLSLKNLSENVRKDLAAGASEVIIVTVDSPAQEKAIELVAKDPSLSAVLDRISFRTIDEFFN